mmetsp:Transcript_83684/g.169797  ORF Transcript_83684/g.169797 Transcript_83684/m.169797 type:complete len:405 (-) Transcript_83684:532-1746(-)
MSAPLNPSVRMESASHNLSMLSPSRIRIRSMCTCRMDFLSERKGSPTCTTRSNRPGRRKAESIIHGVFVAPITITRFPPSEGAFLLLFIFVSTSDHIFMSSKHCNKVVVNFPLPPRFLSVNSAWNSSRKITEGAFFSANSKLEAIVFSLVPTSELTISLMLRDRNVPPSASDDELLEVGFLNSRATALANRVFPQPGGPYSSTPTGGERPNLVSKSLFLRSKASASSNDILACTFPPTDPKCDGDSRFPSFVQGSVPVESGTRIDPIARRFTIERAISKSWAVASVPPALPPVPRLGFSATIHFNSLATLRKALPLAHDADDARRDSRTFADASSVTPSPAKAASKADSIVLAVSNGTRYRSPTMQSRIVDPFPTVPPVLFCCDFQPSLGHVTIPTRQSFTLKT